MADPLTTTIDNTEPGVMHQIGQSDLRAAFLRQIRQLGAEWRRSDLVEPYAFCDGDRVSALGARPPVGQYGNQPPG